MSFSGRGNEKQGDFQTSCVSASQPVQFNPPAERYAAGRSLNLDGFQIFLHFCLLFILCRNTRKDLTLGLFTADILTCHRKNAVC